LVKAGTSPPPWRTSPPPLVAQKFAYSAGGGGQTNRVPPQCATRGPLMRRKVVRISPPPSTQHPPRRPTPRITATVQRRFQRIWRVPAHAGSRPSKAPRSRRLWAQPVRTAGRL
jgi:hypothetical protein